MTSGQRPTPHNDSLTATPRHRNFDLRPSPCRSGREAMYSDEARTFVSDRITKKSKWRRRDSPPLPRPRGERYQSRTPLPPPLLHSSPPPRSKRPRSRTLPGNHSQPLAGHDELYPSRSRSPVSPSRIIDRYRPDKNYTCDNYGCGGLHSHFDCPLPMRCRGCGSTRHFCVACPMVCAGCGYTGHTVAHCSEFIVNGDGKSRPLELSRDYARARQRELYEARKNSTLPQNSRDRSDSLQRHSTQPSNPTRFSSLEPTNPAPKSSQRLAFEEEESIQQARHEADMARKAAAQKLELEHEVRLLEVRRRYAAGLLLPDATPSSVLYPPYDPNGPLEIPDAVLRVESLPVHAAVAAVGEQRGRDRNRVIETGKEIKYEVID